MENQEEVLAQAKLIHANPLANKNIGDSPINWDSESGDPTSVANGVFDGAGFSPYFDSNEYGVVLTEATSGTTGSLSWNKNFDYTKNIHLSGVMAAGGGDAGGGGGSPAPAPAADSAPSDSGSSSSSSSVKGDLSLNNEYTPAMRMLSRVL